MTQVHYEVVRHDGGWAYKVQDVLSETFPTHDRALFAARSAAARQRAAGETIGIRYEDADGNWHDEIAKGDDRPETDVEDVAGAS